MSLPTVSPIDASTSSGVDERIRAASASIATVFASGVVVTLPSSNSSASPMRCRSRRSAEPTGGSGSAAIQEVLCLLPDACRCRRPHGGLHELTQLDLPHVTRRVLQYAE